MTSAYTAVKDPENTKFVYRDRLWAGADMVAGVASFGHLGGIHYQTKPISINTVKLRKIMVVLRRALLLQRMKDFYVNLFSVETWSCKPGIFPGKFGVDIKERRRNPTEWKEAGDLSKRMVICCSSGMLFSDRFDASSILPSTTPGCKICLILS